MSASDRDPPTAQEPELPEVARPLAELVEERFRGLAGHPESEKVLAYATSGLTPAEAEEMREHLSVCGDCLDLLLLRPDLRGAGGEDRALDFETFRAWREMRLRIREHELGQKLARRTRALRWLQVAAALLVLAPGLVWMKVRQDGLRGLEPTVNAAIFDVQQSHVRGLDPARPDPVPPATYKGSTPITVPAGIDSYTLVFWLDARDFDTYEILIHDHDGDEIWRSRDVKVELGTATLGLARRFMKAGRYRVEIYGIGDDGRVQVGDYSIEISYL